MTKPVTQGLTSNRARMFPSKIADGAPLSERAVYAALLALPADWRVFYSVAWQSSAGRAWDGEADFVLLHPRKGLLMLEVKGGEIHIEDGVWISVSRAGAPHEVRNPFEQAVASKHALVRYIKDNNARLPYLPAGHGVVFPDVTTPDDLGPEAPNAVVIDRMDLENFENAVERVCQHWDLQAHLERSHIETFTRLLAPTQHITPLLSDTVRDTYARLMELTGEQFVTLKQLQRNRRAIVYGTAGTGKTVLAAERARRMAQDGFRTLLTCYNRPLADHLSRVLEDASGVEVASFHSFARTTTQKAGIGFPPNPSPGWWDSTLPDLLAEAAEKLKYTVDAIVVDEGQDFHPGWWTVLQMLLTNSDEGPLYIFADPHQSIFRDGWAPPFREPAFDLVVNCRNTLPIAQWVSSIYGNEVSSRGVQGPQPEFVEATSEKELIRALRTILQRLTHDEKLLPNQIAILGTDAKLIERLRERPLASQKLVELGQFGVVTESVRRFKGLEADVVLFVLSSSQGPAQNAPDDRARALAYVGLSRARAHLFVIGNRDDALQIGLPIGRKPT